MDQVNMHRGSCLCGRVRYELSVEPGSFGYCHCRSCQKASGSAFSANAPIARRDFALRSGERELREFESSPGKIRVFCAHCGSPIYAYRANQPDTLRLRLGSLDTLFAKRARAHSWVSEMASWAPICDDVPQFAQWAGQDAKT